MKSKPILLLMALVLFVPSKSFAKIMEQQTIGGSFGVQVKHDRTTVYDLDQIKKMGFGIVRFDMRWSSVEKTKSHYDWNIYDKFIADLRERGIKAIIIIRGGNALYSDLVEVDPKKFWGKNKVAKSPVDEESVEGFIRFAAAAANRYKGDDIIWEIWNEPDRGGFWAPRPDPEGFAKLASKACQEMRSVVPEAFIIGPGLAMLPGVGAPERSSLIAQVLKSPASQCLDAISIHSYRNKDQIPESVIFDYEKVGKFIKEHTPVDQKALPLACSEWGYTLTKVTERQQADYILRAHIANLLSGFMLTVWYEWKDSFKKPNDPEAHYGLLDYERGKKTSYRELEKTLPSIQEAKIEKRIDVDDPQIFIVAIKWKDGRRGILAWVATKGAESRYIKVQRSNKEEIVSITSSPILIQTEKSLPGVVLISSGRF